MPTQRLVAPAAALLLLLAALAPLLTSPPGAAEEAPRLRLAPASGAPGDRVVATGTGFPPRARGDLVWSPTGARLAALRTRADGTFRLRFAVPEAAPGPAAVAAVVGETTAEAEFTVEADGAQWASGGTAATEAPAPTEAPKPADVPTATPTDAPTGTDAPAPTDVPAPTEPAGPSAAEAPGIAAADVPVGLAFAPEADARIAAQAPAGRVPRTLRVDAEPEAESYLRFDVAGLAGAVGRATLELWVMEGTPDGPRIGTAAGDWTEADVDWDGRPEASSDLVGTPGALAAGTWIAYDVTPFVAGDGIYTFRLAGGSADGVTFAAREDRDPDHRPRLVIATDEAGPSPTVTEDAPAPTTTPTRTPTPEATPTTTPTRTPTRTPGGGTGPTATLLAAGDIATCAGAGDEATAKLLDGLAGTVATLGDNVYQSGSAQQYADCYAPTWGRHKARTRPAPGNHDYRTAGAAGYFGYFGAAAGTPGKGYYSYDLGAWHVVVLNSNLDTSRGSAQETWLRADLAAHPAACTLAYWHHPRFSSGSSHGNNTSVQPLWQALYEAGAELVLAGHEHHYERFAPQDPTGGADPREGIRQFVVGTGGAGHYGFGTVRANSEVRSTGAFGVLQLTLHPDGYDWEFVPVAGKTFGDAGSGTCH
jgi:hypothetical protein